MTSSIFKGGFRMSLFSPMSSDMFSFVGFLIDFFLTKVAIELSDFFRKQLKICLFHFFVRLLLTVFSLLCLFFFLHLFMIFNFYYSQIVDCGQHSCLSSMFPQAMLNGTFFYNMRRFLSRLKFYLAKTKYNNLIYCVIIFF